MEFKSGFITIIGKTNVGKSTLMNRILGEKVSIISSKPQTTRNRIMGIYTDDKYQMVFIDTPGIHQGKRGLNRFMVRTAMAARDDADILAVMMEVPKILGEGEFAIETKNNLFHEIDIKVIKGIPVGGPPVILLINKVDRVKKSLILPIIEEMKGHYDFETIIPISALKGSGVEDFTNEIRRLLPEGPLYFPEDAITDKSERFIASEIVREKVFQLTHQEIPYSAAVIVSEFKEDIKRDLLSISALIYVERESQKGMVIGKGGRMIKEIGMRAREGLEAFFGTKIYLDLRVKVNKNWTGSEESLKRLGYS